MAKGFSSFIFMTCTMHVEKCTLCSELGDCSQPEHAQPASPQIKAYNITNTFLSLSFLFQGQLPS
jgi:hypothetical protein